MISRDRISAEASQKRLFGAGAASSAGDDAGGGPSGKRRKRPAGAAGTPSARENSLHAARKSPAAHSGNVLTRSEIIG
jgi:hypothetical protein